MKTYLVTGATGFIGSQLVCQLKETLNCVRVYARAIERQTSCCREDQEEWVLGSLHDRAGLARACEGIDTVFHVAGISDAGSRDTEELIKTNFVGTQEVFNASVRAGVKKFVFFSSILASSPSSSDYARSKSEAEEFLMNRSTENCQIQVIILRPAAVYGEGMQGGICKLIYYASLGVIPALSKLDWSLYMVSVEDLCSVAVALTNRESTNRTVCYTVTDGEKYTLNRVESAIYSALGRKVPKIRVTRFLVKCISIVAKVLNNTGIRYNRIESLSHQLLAGHSNADTSESFPRYHFSSNVTFESKLPTIVAAMKRV